MRILFASRNFFPKGAVGGAQTSIKHLATEFHRRGHEVAILSVDDHEHVGTHEPSGLREYRLKLRNIYTNGEHNVVARTVWHAIDRFGGRMEQPYREVISAFKPDVMFSHVLAGLGTSAWRAASALDVPIVHMVHDYYLLCVKSSMRGADGDNCASPCGFCQRMAVNPSVAESTAVSSVIYVSDHVRTVHQAAGMFPHATSRIIHGSYEPREKVAPRTGLLDPGVLKLGYFGRIAPDKGVLEMLQSLRSFDSMPWSLSIGGSGSHEFIQQVRARSAGLPVEMVGVRQPDEFFSSIDVLIVPSLWNDPAPRTAYEAGIHQVIPVVSAVGGLPQLAGHGSRGLIFNVRDPASLPIALDRLVREPLTMDKIRTNWLSATASFSHSTVAEEILAVLAQASETRDLRHRAVVS